MKPRTKFLIGGALVIGTAGYLAASAIKDTGVYYLTPGELSAKTRTDPTFYETASKSARAWSTARSSAIRGDARWHSR